MSIEFVSHFFQDVSFVFVFSKFVDPMKVPSKAFLLFYLLPDWLKLNHLKSRMECAFQTFTRLICSTIAETIGVANYEASFSAKKCSENHI